MKIIEIILKYEKEIVLSFLSIATAVIAIYAVQRDLNGKIGKYKKYAIMSIWLVSIFTLGSIYETFSSGIESRLEKHISDSTLLSISNKNDSLRNANDAISLKITNSTDTLLNEASRKSILASANLEKSTQRMEEAVFGGYGEINSEAVMMPDLKNFFLIAVNPYEKPQYDVNLTVFDYNKLSTCNNIGDAGEWIFEPSCYQQSMYKEPTFNINSKSNQQMNYQFPIEKNFNNRFYIFIESRRYKFTQELIVRKDGQAFRLFQYDDKLKIKKIIKTWNPYKIKIDWEKEFKIPPNFTYGRRVEKSELF